MTDALHILHVLPYFYPAWAYGGIPRLAWGLCRALVDLGHRVTVVTTDAFDASSRLPEGAGDRSLAGMRVLTLPNLSNRLAYHHQGFLPVGLARAFRRLEDDPPDLFHLHGHRHILNNVARHYALAWGRPYIFTPNGTLPAIERKLGIKKVFDLFLGNAVVRDARFLVAVSRAEVAQLREAGVPGEKVIELPNGLDLAEFEPPVGTGGFRRWLAEGETEPLARTRLLEGPLVLFLGKLTPRKGVDHLLEAFARLETPQATLVIAGNDMGVGAELTRLADQLRLGNRVKFTGLLTGQTRLEALRDATVLVYPSSWEIFGLVPFEGLLSGAPAVVGDDCGCGELVRAAGAGVLVPWGQAGALADALSRLLADEGMRQAMVSRGQDYIRRFLSWDRVAPLTVEVYRAALHASRAR